MQSQQDQHDILSHTDIKNMPDTDALQHFAMHFAKYSWTMREAVRVQNDGLKHKILVDIMIICLAAANRLNITNLARRVFDQSPTAIPYADAFQEQMAIMCKAGEAADHKHEIFPVRDVMQKAVVAIARLTWDESQADALDLQRAIQQRWAGIEEQQRIA